MKKSFIIVLSFILLIVCITASCKVPATEKIYGLGDTVKTDNFSIKAISGETKGSASNPGVYGIAVNVEITNTSKAVQPLANLHHALTNPDGTEAVMSVYRYLQYVIDDEASLQPGETVKGFYINKYTTDGKYVLDLFEDGGIHREIHFNFTRN